MIQPIFCPQCDTYLEPNLATCPACGQVRPTVTPVPIAWTVELGQSPARPPLLAGTNLLWPTHDSDSSPHQVALQWLALADGLPTRPPLRLESGQLVSGVRPVRFAKPDRSGLLLATYSADPTAAVGSLLALDTAGQEIWRWQPGVQAVSAPALAGETAWVTTNTGLLTGLNLATGAEQTRIPLGLTPALAAPLVVEGVAYLPTRGPRLVAMGLDGQRRWQFETISLSGWFDRTPLLVGERLYLVANLTGLIVALERASGQVTWQAELGPQVGKRLSPPATAGTRLYVGAGDGLHTFDLADGRPIWHFPTERRIEAAPVVSAEVVYAAGHDHCLYALEAATGRELWRYAAAARIEVAPLLLDEPPLLVIADRKGQVTALERPLEPEQHQAAERWLEAAAGYVARGELTRAAELLQAHGEPFKAAQVWQAAGQLEPAAQQYEAAGRWIHAAELWGQLDRPLPQAEALEHHAQSLAGQPAGEEDRARAWETAAAAFETLDQTDRAASSRLQAARARGLPYLTVEVEYERLVMHRWTRLKFSVSNSGGGAAHSLIIRARGGQFEGQVAETRQIISLQPGQSRADWLDVRPLAPGKSVPLRVTIDYQDNRGDSGQWQKTLYLPVAATDQREATGEKVVAGSADGFIYGVRLPLGETSMAGLSTELYQRCRNTLLQCVEFDSNSALRAVFVTAELRPFQTSLPEAANKGERVDLCLNFLLTRRLRDGRTALALFITALRDRYEPGDGLRDELDTLARDVPQAFETPTGQTTPPGSSFQQVTALESKRMSMDQDYYLQNIRTVLIEGFSAEELRRLCYDNADFRPVYHELSGGMGKTDIVDHLITHANQSLVMDKLLGLVRQLNPTRYERHKPYVLPSGQTSSGSAPSETGVKVAGPETDSSLPSFKQIKRQTLQKRLTGLIADYQAAQNQLDSALGEVERTRLKRQIEALEQEIQQLENELNLLG